MTDNSIEEFMKTLDQEAVSTVKMLTVIGPVMSVNEARETILKIGKHPNDEIGNSPLYLPSEYEVFRKPKDEDEK